MNQLQMALFTWIKANPSPSGLLYVMDEAQNFVPSQQGAPCKESANKLAAQARKYGLGMILATQKPKGIDNGIVSNCTTHIYGRMGSGTTLDAIKDLIRAKGGEANDWAASAGANLIFQQRDRAGRSDPHASLLELASGKSAASGRNHRQGAAVKKEIFAALRAESGKSQKPTHRSSRSTFAIPQFRGQHHLG